MTSAAPNTSIGHHLHETFAVNHHHVTSFQAPVSADVTVRPQLFPDSLNSEPAAQNNSFLHHVRMLPHEHKFSE